MMERSSPLLVRMVSTSSCCRGDSLVSARSAAMPITAFMGVRISWLMFARNWLLATVAASTGPSIKASRNSVPI